MIYIYFNMSCVACYHLTKFELKNAQCMEK
jgi:hypothetical protein